MIVRVDRNRETEPRVPIAFFYVEGSAVLQESALRALVRELRFRESVEAGLVREEKTHEDHGEGILEGYEYHFVGRW